MEQENKTNIRNILENAPKGLKLYCTVYGDVEYLGLIDFETSGSMFSHSKPMIEIYAENVGRFVFDDYGKWYKSGECLLFPSNSNSWNFWQYYLLKPYDIIYADTTNADANGVLMIEHKDKAVADVINGNGVRSCRVPIGSFRYATECERQSFFENIKKHGMKYDTERGLLPDADDDVCDKARMTFTYEDISGQRTLITPFDGYEAKIEDGKVILYKKKEPFFRSGERYVALKDINVSLTTDNGKFKKGRIYISDEDNTVKSDKGGMFIDRHDGKGEEFFIHITVDKCSAETERL